MRSAIRNLVSTAASLLLLSACSSQLMLTVESEIPVPLTRRLPLTAGIHYSENFREFQFHEDSEDRPNWTIDNREARLALFNEVMPRLFENIVMVDAVTATESSLDVIIAPEVVEMQVALPEETRTDMYEAWVRYTINIYRPGGEPVNSWPLTGYGKTQTAMFMNRTTGLNTAINNAMRDVGAKLVLDLPDTPGIRELLVTGDKGPADDDTDDD